MGSMRFKHNKKRNSGLIYEFLVRRMTQSLIEKNSDDYKKSLIIIKKYFAKGQPLDKERQLFEAITSTRGIKNVVARGIIKEVSSAARNLDHKVLDIKKSNIIKDIHRALGRSLFSSYRLQEYKAYASIQLLVNSCNPRGSIQENVQRVQLEEALVNYMTSTAYQAEKVNSDPLVYKIALNKFNERYNESLGESQKILLKKYAKALAVPELKVERSIKTLLLTERKKLVMELAKFKTNSEVVKDKDMSKKLSAAIIMLRDMNLNESIDKGVEDLLLYCSLVEELKSDV